MKKINLITLCLTLIICFGIRKVSGQPGNSSSTSINITPSPPESYEFEAINMPPLNGSSAAYYSYLWWMADNGFSFSPSPVYSFQMWRKGVPGIVSMIGTGNYSTGGPPPIYKPFKPTVATTNTLGLFSGNQNLLVQNYRNAVIGDVMYLLVSYKLPVDHNPNPNIGYSGTISINMPSQYASAGAIPNGAGTSYTPNGEIFNGTNSWTFNDLRYGVERSILVPVEISSNDLEHLDFSVHLNLEGSSSEEQIEGVNFFPLRTTVAKSHDPNQMIAHSAASDNCDYGGKPINYTVQFQNEGDAATKYVKVVCVLDEKLNTRTIDNIKVPNMYNGSYQPGAVQGMTYNLEQCNYVIDHSTNSITFEFHGLYLLSPTDPLCRNLNLTKEQVSFSIEMLPNFRFGPAVVSIAEITFDTNAVIETNHTTVICDKPYVGDKGGFYDVPTPPTPSDPFPIKTVIALVALFIAGGVVIKRRRAKK